MLVLHTELRDACTLVPTIYARCYGNATMIELPIASALAGVRVFLRRVIVISMLTVGFPALGQSLVPTPITMPGVTVLTPSPFAFQPLVVRADFSKAYCLSEDYPIYAQVGFVRQTPPDAVDVRAGLVKGVLSVALSHLRSGSCVMSKTFTVPGLPAGSHTLRISVTADDSGGIQVRRTYEAEVGQTTLTVSQPAGIGTAVMCMARVDLPTYGPYGTGPVMLTGRCSEEPVFSTPRTNGTTPLEIGTATPSFYVYGALTGTALPSPFTQLYAVPYPSPLAGLFWTTSIADCAAMNQAWNGKASCDSSTLIVLRSKSGVCPLGTSPVYRVFQAQAVAHRYTQSADTYAALLEANHVGEGTAWCAPLIN